jgi:hypothetical protein
MPGSKSALALLYLTLLWMVVQMVAVPFIAVRQRLPISHANHQSQATLSGGAWETTAEFTDTSASGNLSSMIGTVFARFGVK